MNNSQNQLKKLTTRLWAGIFLVFIMLLSGALFLYGLHVKALFGDYTNKGPGDTLTADEWNDLDRDFVNIPVGGCSVGEVVQFDGANWVCAVAGGVSFGAWVSITDSNSRQAFTDGIVTAYNTIGANIEGLTDGSDPPITPRTRMHTSVDNPGISFPVKKNDYWRVINASQIYWIPIISSGGGAGPDYDSGWVASPGLNTNTTFTHNFGQRARDVRIWVAENNDGSGWSFISAGLSYGNGASAYTVVGVDIAQNNINDINIRIAEQLGWSHNGTSHGWRSSGFIKVLAWQ